MLCQWQSLTFNFCGLLEDINLDDREKTFAVGSIVKTTDSQIATVTWPNAVEIHIISLCKTISVDRTQLHVHEGHLFFEKPR